MKRTYNLIMYFSIIVSFTSCSYFQYADSVRKESKRKFDDRKVFMLNIAFEGQIIDKRYCEKCKVNKYILEVNLKRIIEKPSFAKAQYPPYYEFKNDSILEITVSQGVFEQTQKMNRILKVSGSNYIKVEQNELLYLSKNSSEWIP